MKPILKIAGQRPVMADGDLTSIQLLALECGTWRASVALARGGEITEKASEDKSAKNSDVLLPMAKGVLTEAGLQWSQLDAIAFGAGPGAFTGLRVACGLAQGLAFGIARPLIPIGSLEGLAEGLIDYRSIQEGTTVMATLDARMGEIYLAILSRSQGDWKYLVSPSLLTSDDISRYVSDVDFMVGDGLLLKETLPEPHKWVEEAPQQPTASAMARLARTRLIRGQGQDPLSAQLFYVRDKVALTSKERGQSGG